MKHKNIPKFRGSYIKYLVNVVAALCDEGVVVGEEIGPLQHSVQLQLGFIAGLRGDGDCKKIARGHKLDFAHLQHGFEMTLYSIQLKGED